LIQCPKKKNYAQWSVLFRKEGSEDAFFGFADSLVATSEARSAKAKIATWSLVSPSVRASVRPGDNFSFSRPILKILFGVYSP
jgi:hypothetical protein